MDIDEINQITEMIIGSAYQIGNALGCGFLEKVYENTLAYEIRKKGLEARQQEKIKVYYDNVEVGDYEADILVSGKVTEDKEKLASLIEELALLYQVGIRICVVHGGGKQLSELAERLGVVQKVVNGRRVTGDDTLELAKMIFAGKRSTRKS